MIFSLNKTRLMDKISVMSPFYGPVYLHAIDFVNLQFDGVFFWEAKYFPINVELKND